MIDMIDTEQRTQRPALGRGGSADTGHAGRIVRLPELLRLTGMSRSGAYRAMEAGTFPRQVAIGPRAVGWRHDEVIRWIDGRAPR